MDQLYCPDCKPVLSKSGNRLTGRLMMVEDNYSGCGVDYMSCGDCGHVFCVSYRVDEIRRDEAWEDKEEVERLAQGEI